MNYIPAVVVDQFAPAVSAEVVLVAEAIATEIKG